MSEINVTSSLQFKSESKYFAPYMNCFLRAYNQFIILACSEKLVGYTRFRHANSDLLPVLLLLRSRL